MLGFLDGEGEAHALMRSLNAQVSPIGAPAAWPAALRTLVEVILGSTEPMFVVWGPERSLLYNAPYGEVLANKHPSMGRDFLQVWSEIRDDLAPLVARAYAGEPTSMDDIPLLTTRKGYPEQTWWHFSYTPIRAEDASIGGFLCTCHEVTPQVLSDERKTRLLDLEARLRAATTPQAVLEAACAAIGLALGGMLATFNEFTEDGEHLDVTGEWRAGDTASLIGRHRLSDWGEGRVAELRSGQVEMVADTKTDPRLSAAARAAYASLGCQSSLNAPLVRDGRVRAMLAVGAAEPRRWSEAETELATAMMAHAWDALERARAEAALRESEERLRLATDNAEVGFWDVDEVNQRLHWPPIVKAMFGISADRTVTMQDFFDGLHPDDREEVGAAYAAAADPAGRALYDVEYRTIGKEDGVLRWVAAKGRGVFDEAGRCLRVTGTAVEITHRKQVEAALKALNADLERKVVERTRERSLVWRHSLDLLSVVDLATGAFDAVNPAWATALGFPTDQIEGHAFLEYLHPDDVAASSVAFAQALKGNPVLHFENRYRTRDGGWRWLSWVAAPDGGKLYSVTRDVTEEKAQREALEMAQEALRQAQKMEAVGQLTGGIAHDFNNLLQGVAGSLDLIRRKPGDHERVQRWAQAGFAAAERGAKLTAQLLAFSRAQKMELKPVALSDLVAGFREMIDRTIGAHIRVHLDLTTDGIRVLGDDVQIEMAVLNLALNARDAMPEGGVLTITTRCVRLKQDPELGDGDYVELAVRDTGRGMSADVVKRAIDPFFTTKGVGKGTGLGLSQVYGAMRQAGGSVRIESQPGEGTVVRLLLRRTDELAPNSGDMQEPSPQARFSARILVIDDDPDVRRFLQDSLDSLGFEVIEAEDGYAGLAALERSAPDLLIVDFAMPGLNGAEVAKRVQEHRPDLPIIFATGFADSSAIEAVVGKEAAVLRKPFGLDDLQRAVIGALASAG